VIFSFDVSSSSGGPSASTTRKRERERGGGERTGSRGIQESPPLRMRGKRGGPGRQRRPFDGKRTRDRGKDGNEREMANSLSRREMNNSVQARIVGRAHVQSRIYTGLRGAPGMKLSVGCSRQKSDHPHVGNRTCS
jgi:hypothetical protein